MNILFLFNCYPGFGGLESVSNNLIDYIGKVHSVYTLSSASDSSAIISSCVKGSYVFKSRKYSDRCRYYNAVVRDRKIDCVVNQGIFPQVTRVIFNKDRNRDVRIISALHGVPGYERVQFWMEPYMQDRPLFKRVLHRFLLSIGIYGRYNDYLKSYRRSYRKATIEGSRVVLLADGYRHEFMSIYGLGNYGSKIICIENPLPEKILNIQGIPVSERENIVLYVGRLAPEKRVNLIIDLWKSLNTDGWSLYIVGDGSQREELEKQAQDCNNICFTRFVTNPEEYYRRGKILVLTSVFEGYGMSLLEAQGCGAVPVAFDVSAGVRSVVEDAGILVPDNDMEALEEAVSSLMMDRFLLESLSSKAIERARHNDIRSIGNKWLELLDEK